MGVPCWLCRIVDGIQLCGYASAMGTAQPGTDFSDDGGYQSFARQFSAHVGWHLSVDAIQIRLLEALPCTAAIPADLLA